jgi:hypothetical protein
MSKTLLEITGQESGIVVYDNKVIVCNWAQECSDGGLPVAGPINNFLLAWPQELEVSKEYEVDSVLDALPSEDDMEILADFNSDIPALYGIENDDAIVNKDENGNLEPTEGKVYHINDAIVIAPYGWN